MIVQCKNCNTKFRLSDEKVKGKAVKVRCSKCKEVFTVDATKEADASIAGGPAPEEAS